MKVHIKSTVCILSFLLLTLSKNALYAQFVTEEPEKTTFIGVGIGINDYGFGGGIEFPILPKIYGLGNVGIGGWGYKLGAGIAIHPRGGAYGSAWGFGYSYASGIKDFETDLYVEPYDEQQTISLDLNPAHTINFTYSYSWKLGRSGKFSLSAGYAVPLNIDAYEVKSTGVKLNEESLAVMRILQPGGLIIGMKFMFGI